MIKKMDIRERFMIDSDKSLFGIPGELHDTPKKILFVTRGIDVLDITVFEELGIVFQTSLIRTNGKKLTQRQYQKRVYQPNVGETLKQEIFAVTPDMIVLCGTWRPFHYHIKGYNGEIYCMAYPSKNMSCSQILEDLKKEMGLSESV
ncbi:MAG: hypothetical protein ACI3XI_00860 [Eubacteriales bacterium]